MISSRISNADRKKIYRRDGFACALCGNPKTLQIHHLYARSAGGKDTPHNLITVCQDCHMALHGHALDGTTYNERMERLEWAFMAATEYLADYYAPNWDPWDET